MENEHYKSDNEKAFAALAGKLGIEVEYEPVRFDDVEYTPDFRLGSSACGTARFVEVKGVERSIDNARHRRFVESHGEPFFSIGDDCRLYAMSKADGIRPSAAYKCSGCGSWSIRNVDDAYRTFCPSCGCEEYYVRFGSLRNATDYEDANARHMDDWLQSPQMSESVSTSRNGYETTIESIVDKTWTFIGIEYRDYKLKNKNMRGAYEITTKEFDRPFCIRSQVNLRKTAEDMYELTESFLGKKFRITKTYITDENGLVVIGKNGRAIFEYNIERVE